MKRRVIKKWINRYITPLTKEMPKANYTCMTLVSEDDPTQLHIVAAERLRLANGEWIGEAQRMPKSKGLRNDIINCAKTLESTSFVNPYLRLHRYTKRYGFGIRIFDYKDWPEGYVYKPFPEEL